MDLLVTGLSHQSAPLDLRERVALTADELPHQLGQLIGGTRFEEGLILSTCNRTEIYARTDRQSDVSTLVEFVEGIRPSLRHQVARHLYVHEGDDAVRHLFRVTAGLESMMLGEVEIARQVSDAYETALSVGTAGPLLRRAVPRALQVGKRVRTETAISRGIASLAGAAVGLADRVFRYLSECTIVTAGAGRTVETGLKILRPRARGGLVVTNRTMERAERLAETYEGIAAPLSDLARHAAEADIVIAATGTKEPVLRAAELLPLIARRRSRPLLILDLGVPRNVDRALADRPGIYLHDIDDLQVIAERGRAQRCLELPKAEAIISLAVVEFHRRRRELDAAPAIRALLDGLLRIRDDVIAGEKNLQDTEREALHRITGRFVDRMLRRAAPRLKDGSISSRDLLNAFGIEVEEEAGIEQDVDPAQDGDGGEEKA